MSGLVYERASGLIKPVSELIMSDADKIRNVFNLNPGKEISNSKIIEMTKISQNTVDYTLYRLTRDGFIKKPRRGLYIKEDQEKSNIARIGLDITSEIDVDTIFNEIEHLLISISIEGTIHIKNNPDQKLMRLVIHMAAEILEFAWKYGLDMESRAELLRRLNKYQV